MNSIALAHGNGGVETNNLIHKVFEKYLGKFMIGAGEDAGIFGDFKENRNSYCLSTDSYVVSPIFFSGGDIGKLSICGSSNDVAMMGAKPRYLSVGFIIEEGFEIANLEKILTSMARELKEGKLKILSADTKVVPKGACDKIFINTTAVGEVEKTGISCKNLCKNDVIILSGDIGRHGCVIFCERNDIGLVSNLKSDCKALYPMLERIFSSSLPIHALRDATRGGIASVLNEWANASCVQISLEEANILVKQEVKGVCEILGLEPYSLANEGVCILAVPAQIGQDICKMLNSHSIGKDATIIGEVIEENTSNPCVILRNQWGGKRFLDYPQGELLPRIC